MKSCAEFLRNVTARLAGTCFGWHLNSPGEMRHAVYLGLQADKQAGEGVRETETSEQIDGRGLTPSKTTAVRFGIDFAQPGPISRIGPPKTPEETFPGIRRRARDNVPTRPDREPPRDTRHPAVSARRDDRSARRLDMMPTLLRPARRMACRLCPHAPSRNFQHARRRLATADVGAAGNRIYRVLI